MNLLLVKYFVDYNLVILEMCCGFIVCFVRNLFRFRMSIFFFMFIVNI